MRIGLVLEGGGAKGAYQFGVLKALHAAGLRYDAISGTSVGALNALIVATDSFEDGETLWRGMKQADCLPFRLPIGSKLNGYVLRIYALFHAFWRLAQYAVPFESEDSKIDRRILAAWVLLHVLPLIVVSIEVFPEGFARAFLPFHPLQATALTLWMALVFGGSAYMIGSALSAQQWINGFSVLTPLPVFRFGIYAMFLIGWNQTIFIEAHPYAWSLGAATLFVLVRLTSFVTDHIPLTDNAPLRAHVARFLRKPLQADLFVTTAVSQRVSDPDYASAAPEVSLWTPLGGAPSFALARRLEYFPVYFDFNDRSSAEVEKVVASAALPFGIAPSIQIDGLKHVDGGLVDNVPVTPLVLIGGLDLLIVIILRETPDVPDYQVHFQNMMRKFKLLEWEMPDFEGALGPRMGREMRAKFEEEVLSGKAGRQIPLPPVPEDFPAMRQIKPDRDLGDLLQFEEKHLEKLIAIGEGDGLRFLSDNPELLVLLKQGAEPT